MHPTDKQQNEITYSRGVAEMTMNLLGNWSVLTLQMYLQFIVGFGVLQSFRHFLCDKLNYKSKAFLRTRTSYCDRSFAVCGPTVWNSLPASLRSIDSFAAFCRRLKTFLFDSVAA